ncbi:unnamed protein product [Peniophora sp. CBMAI 1063]|nr:unnamed protein product [Peniophora sp. CBMAI 1063]
MEGFSAHVKGSLWVICRGSSTQRKVRLLRIAAHRLLCARRDRDREVADAQVPLNGVALVCVIMMHISKPATCFATARFLPRRSQRGSGSLPALIERAEGPIPFAVSRFALSTLSAEDSVATERCAENSVRTFPQCMRSRNRASIWGAASSTTSRSSAALRAPRSATFPWNLETSAQTHNEFHRGYSLQESGREHRTRAVPTENVNFACKKL